MVRAFSPRSGKRSTSGTGARPSGANWHAGPSVSCMMSACPGATSFARPKSRSGAPERPLRAGGPCCGTAGHHFSKPMVPVMIALRLNDLRQHSDLLRLRGGKSITVRFLEPGDAGALQAYFRSLTTRSRYNRFLGAISELPQTVLEHFIHVGEEDQFSVIATMTVDGFETIVGEARY